MLQTSVSLGGDTFFLADMDDQDLFALVDLLLEEEQYDEAWEVMDFIDLFVVQLIDYTDAPEVWEQDIDVYPLAWSF